MSTDPPRKSGSPTPLASAQTVPEGGPFEPERAISADELPIQLGRYLLVEELGRGGMGVVYRAIDRDLHREVALKRLHADLFRHGAIQRFLGEARAQAGLRHPNLCEVYAIETIDGAPFFVMRLVLGRSLESVLQGGPLPPRRAARTARDLGRALG
jgi:serine/threonine protein kinase